MRVTRQICLLCSVLLITTSAFHNLEAQSVETITPSFFGDSPVVLSSRKATKKAQITRDGSTHTIMEGSEELRRTRIESKMTYVRYQWRQMSDGAVSVDTVEFSVSDFSPISRKSVSANDTLAVRFSASGVAGRRDSKSGMEDLTTDFGGLFFDSNILDYLCAILSRFGPRSYVVPLYIDRLNTLEAYSVTVSEPEEVEFLAEGEKATKVVYKNPEGREGIVWIEADGTRILREEAHPAPNVDLVMEWKYE